MSPRRSPPSTPDLPLFRLPRYEQALLANGLEVLAVHDDRLPLVHWRLGFPAGSKFDPADLRGLSETTAAVMTQGTARRSARQIAERAAALGASLRAWSNADALVLEGSVLAENLTDFLELATDVVQNAAYPEEEVQLRKQHRKQEVTAQRSLADFLAQERMAELVFGQHPYARQEPTPESIERISRGDLAGFHARHMTPPGAIAVLVGALPPLAELVEQLGLLLGGWTGSGVPAAGWPEPPPPRRVVVLVDRPGSVQADLRIGRLAVTRTHPDYFPLLVASTILGGGASSRLFTGIREQRGYAYDAHSTLTAWQEAGIVEVVTQIREEVLPEALAAVLDEMRRMGRESVSSEELETALNYLCGVFVIRLETLHGVAGQLAFTRLLGLPLAYLEEYASRVRSVTADQVRDAAARYLDPESSSIVVVGDADRIHRSLEPFGAIQCEKAP
ncbi:MAG: pitrilysin family protein [Bryobacterales bacterium]|nr:insulinase family protein [Bryobacteraceae bacterium]MDW8129366.1 pitrilysin family protein [Bryobacterales bacterium]